MQVPGRVHYHSAFCSYKHMHDVPLHDQGMTTELYNVLVQYSMNNEYWSKCKQFIDQISSKNFDMLTYKQMDWALQIIAQLDFDNNKRIAADLFADVEPGSLDKGDIHSRIKRYSD